MLDRVQPWLKELPGERAQALYLAALLHEFGHGRIAAPVLNPRYRETGAGLVREVLFRLDLPGLLRDHVVYLVRSHTMPAPSGMRSAGLGRLLRLAWTLDTRLLYLLAQADCQVRGLSKAHPSCQAVAAFRQRCEQLGIFGREPPPLIPPERWRELAATDPWVRRRLAGELRFWRLKGRLTTAEQAEAWLASQSPSPAGTLYLTVGVPGSGKTTWVSRCLGKAHRISMDELRERLLGSRADQSRNAEIFRRARSELHRALQAGETVVWDAQSHTWATRQGLLALAREAHAYVIPIYFDVPLAVALERNAQRSITVPEPVIVRNYGALQEPRPFEGEELWRVDVHGYCSRYIGNEETGAGDRL